MAFVSAVLGRRQLRPARRARVCRCSAGQGLDAAQYVGIGKARQQFESVAKRYPGGEDALLERLGRSCADVISETFPVDVNPTVVVICGKDLKGAVGYHTAVELSRKEYSVTMLACEQNRKYDEDMVRAAGMNYIEFVPGPIEYIYSVFVDAMIGLEYDNAPLQDPYASAIEKIANSEKPTVSIDVPTGWDLQRGPKDEDLWRGVALKPDLLISLGVPKVTARRFGGAFHYIAGDLYNAEELAEIEVKLPTYPKSSDFVLVGGNPALFGWGKKPGEIYGNEGAYMATLFPGPQERRKWVDIDDDPNLWDELD